MEQEKKYLKTIEEVSDALAAGKVVFCDDNKTKYHKDKNGFVIGENEEFGDCVGDIVEISNTPYILEPKPLAVKLWHLYEDVKGRRILIFHKDNTSLYPFSGEIFTETGYYDYSYFSKDGKSSHIDKKNLVKELADLSKYFKKGDENEKND